MINMRGGLFDSIVLLEKGVVFNNLSITNTVIKDYQENIEKQPPIVLRGQIDNMELKSCLVYTKDPWLFVVERSTNIHEQGNWPPSQEEMYGKRISQKIKIELEEK